MGDSEIRGLNRSWDEVETGLLRLGMGRLGPRGLGMADMETVLLLFCVLCYEIGFNKANFCGCEGIVSTILRTA